MKRSAKSTISKFEEPVEKRQVVEIVSQSSQVETSQEIKHYEPLENGIYWTKVSVLDAKYNEKALSLFELINRVNPIASIHFNFNMDVNFIIRSYPRRCRETPISLVIGQHHYSDLNNSIKQLKLSNITTAAAKLPIPYGTHHTKLSMFESEDAVHVVISTANLILEDWTVKTDAFYYARAPFKKSEHSAEQNTSKLAVQEMNPFQKDLIEYLKKAYSDSGAWKLVEYWVDRLSHGVDFSAVKDRIIASVPGRHLGPEMHLFGHMKLRKLLSQKFSPEQLKKLNVKICQFSSIGSMGSNPKTWLGDQFLDSLSGGKGFSTNMSTSLKLIFPTAENVRTSLEGYMAGGSLMNYKKTSDKQPFMTSYLHQWKSDNLGRTHAMPHIKTFTALESADGVSKPAWFVITSANLSQAAWGTLEKTMSQLFIRSYELGVLLCAEDHPVLERLPLPYDLPLTKYGDSDKIWVTDGTFLKPDINGNSWSRPE
uniref:Tyrosyl-DNA phosphodiesterase n=1 Tax=Acrobeloides nanus TaxID=290746 RepID=A0A914EKP4_9BILA